MVTLPLFTSFGPVARIAEWPLIPVSLLLVVAVVLATSEGRERLRAHVWTVTFTTFVLFGWWVVAAFGPV